MSVEYTWKLVALNKTATANLSDVVVQTRWECTGTDEDGVTGVFNGATPFNPNNVNQSEFVPYENLTEEIVLNWIKAIAVGEYWNHIRTMIDRQIMEKKNPIQTVSQEEFPWS